MVSRLEETPKVRQIQRRGDIFLQMTRVLRPKLDVKRERGALPMPSGALEAVRSVRSSRRALRCFQRIAQVRGDFLVSISQVVQESSFPRSKFDEVS
jgi:hypothetical protein